MCFGVLAFQDPDGTSPADAEPIHHSSSFANPTSSYTLMNGVPSMVTSEVETSRVESLYFTKKVHSMMEMDPLLSLLVPPHLGIGTYIDLSQFASLEL